jgi:type I restriction enzyme R subunit
MNTPRPERVTQNRVIKLFTAPLAENGLGYEYLGDWSNRENSPIEDEYLKKNLTARGYSEAKISAALTKLKNAVDIKGATPYQANQRTYQLLRYGISVQVAIGSPHETVHLIDWDHPELNHFALAEEVTLKENHERRPDIVLYLNGLAIAVIELKKGSVEVGDGIRQLISNQEKPFNPGFFSTVQLVLAGNDSQGLRYGTTGTPEQFFVQWKDEFPEQMPSDVAGVLLDRPLAQLLRQDRLLDLIRDCMIFDAGQKKVPRQHQYQGFKAAQERIRQREGGVIWHTQGSGKSILMVLLARWILEYDPDGRVLLVTDRDELDRQIEQVVRNADLISKEAPSPRITSRAELARKLDATQPRLLCALLHKFDPKDLKGELPPIYGRFYVFVDECHRTQGGDMNTQMKRWMKNSIFIGFTGTPLLLINRKTTREVFGTFIHTYKFHEAVTDGVVLDLRYEARNVPQRLDKPERIDAWFNAKTPCLNNYQKAVLRKRWATMEKLMSSKGRKERIVADIVQDFGLKPRLSNDRGTAILVAASIYDACHYYQLFQGTPLDGCVGIITSYEPNPQVISKEAKGSKERYAFETYTNHVLQGEQPQKYIEDTKKRFIEEPANMKLLVVVSKLLTGFDAPSCTYIYLDHALHDHTLFQAICRTNRLDGEDKTFGHIVDYKELFKDVQEAVAIYNSDELDTDLGNGGENNIHIGNWLTEGRKHFEEVHQALLFLCEPVLPPRQMEQFIFYFCGHAADPEALKTTEPLRIAFYKAVATFIRAFATIAQHLTEAGYSEEEAAKLKKETDFYAQVREEVKNYSGEELDTKPYEADMRYLINTYILADSPEPLGHLDDLSLTELIIQTGIHDAIARKLNARGTLSNKAIAEGIINNIRKTIIRDRLTDPQFYEQMSKLLDDLIQLSEKETESYEKFLLAAEALAKKYAAQQPDDTGPDALKNNTVALRLYWNLPKILADADLTASALNPLLSETEALAALALQIDQNMLAHAPSGWRGDVTKERSVGNILFPLVGNNRAATAALLAFLASRYEYP